MRPVLYAAVLGLCVSLVGCAADPSDEASSTAGDATGDNEIRAAKPVTLADEGKTITVTKGSDLKVVLDVKNPGYAWAVTSVSRSLGYPVKPEGELKTTAAGTTATFVWKTDSPFLSPGPTAHDVTFLYNLPDEKIAPAMREFSFKVVIKAAKDAADPEPAAAKPVTLADDGQSITVTKGDDVQVVLDVKNPGYAWAVTSVSRSLGYPVKPEGEIKTTAAGTTATFVWKTDSPFLTAGPTAHEVKFLYNLPDEKIAPAMREFSFKLVIKAPAQSP